MFKGFKFLRAAPAWAQYHFLCLSLDASSTGSLRFAGKAAGGFFVFEPEIFKFITGDHTYLEREPLQNISKKKQLYAYKHHGFWQCMDTMRDKKVLSDLWKEKKAPWKKK